MMKMERLVWSGRKNRGDKGRTEINEQQEIQGWVQDDKIFDQMTFYSSGRPRPLAIGPDLPLLGFDRLWLMISERWMI